MKYEIKKCFPHWFEDLEKYIFIHINLTQFDEANKYLLTITYSVRWRYKLFLFVITRCNSRQQRDIQHEGSSKNISDIFDHVTQRFLIFLGIVAHLYKKLFALVVYYEIANTCSWRHSYQYYYYYCILHYLLKTLINIFFCVIPKKSIEIG